MKTHDITGSPDGDLSNYQLKFIVHSVNGVDQGNDVYLNEHSLSWPYDIRFCNNNGLPLDYWIESYDDRSAIIWVKIDYIQSKPALTTIRMYYGKSGAIDASNGFSTFLFFDDFNGTTLDSGKWTATHGTGTISVENSVLTIGNAGGETANITSISSYGAGTALRAKLISAHTSNKLDEGINWWTDYYDNAIIAFYSGNNSFMYEKYRAARFHDEDYMPIIGWSANKWHIQDIERFNSNNIRYLVDNSNMVSESRINSISKGDSQLRIFASYPEAQMKADWILVRSFTDNEPINGCWSPEKNISAIIPQWIVIGTIALLLFVVILFLVTMGIVLGYLFGKGKNRSN